MAAWPRSYKPNCFALGVDDLSEQVDGGEVVDDEVIQNGRRRRGDAARRSGTQRLRGGDESRARRGEEREEGGEPRHFFVRSRQGEHIAGFLRLGAVRKSLFFFER